MWILRTVLSCSCCCVKEDEYLRFISSFHLSRIRLCVSFREEIFYSWVAGPAGRWKVAAVCWFSGVRGLGFRAAAGCQDVRRLRQDGGSMAAVS